MPWGTSGTAVKNVLTLHWVSRSIDHPPVSKLQGGSIFLLAWPYLETNLVFVSKNFCQWTEMQDTRKKWVQNGMWKIQADWWWNSSSVYYWWWIKVWFFQNEPTIRFKIDKGMSQMHEQKQLSKFVGSCHKMTNTEPRVVSNKLHVSSFSASVHKETKVARTIITCSKFY